VIAEPPLLTGAVKLTVMFPSPAVATTPPGAPGTSTSVNVFEAAELAPVPTLLVALTVHVYPTPRVIPAIVIGLAVPLTVISPALQLTVYPVMAAPPLSAGATKLTANAPRPPVIVTPVGTPGNPTGKTEFDAADAAPVPTSFVAVTVQMYAVPFVRPVTVIGLMVPVAVSEPQAAV